ncbi:MAG: pyruvate kinase [Pseudomonadota bacterium]
MADICVKSPLSPARLRDAEALIENLESLRRRALQLEAELTGDLPATRRASARNLVHYLALRQADLRHVQRRLALLGLSRLARSEAHTLASLDAVLAALHALAGRQPRRRKAGPVSIGAGGRLLDRHARELLGDKPGGRDVRIMVTLPSVAASQPELLRDLLLAGMDVMRINCAHDEADDWLAMIDNLRAAQRATGRPCRIYADLAGPKLRTGALRPLGRKLEFKPERDLWGRVARPARIWITPRDNPEPAPEGVAVVLPVTGALLAEARPGDSLALEDSRGGQRDLTLAEGHGRSWLALAQHHVYLRDGAACVLYRDVVQLAKGVVGPLPEVVAPLQLRMGDRLLLTPEDQPGGPARHDDAGDLLEHASIPCTLDAVFHAARPGQPIWFDDGRIGGVILSAGPRRILLEITQAPPQGARLRPEKGINLPETELDVPALTAKDLADLAVLAPHVDMVGLSFVRRPQDVLDLHRHLAELGAERLGTVLKIETRQGFDNLPRILLASLAHPPVGVMVARGDLAVEIGFERLAEVQEEILWLCEAAHVPVIWATQVLESMAKRGLPSRAEVSDAAFGVRAECVMLNKGPYIIETTRFLGGVLARMAGHHAKRRPVMRRLAVSGGL